MFDPLCTELTARGHHSVAPQLPVSDGTATWHDYADAIQASMAGLVEPPVLVGHSLTGWPDCPIVAICMSLDRSIGPDYPRYVAHERLGVEPLEFPGDHSPFLSQATAFADFLVAATTAQPRLRPT